MNFPLFFPGLLLYAVIQYFVPEESMTPKLGQAYITLLQTIGHESFVRHAEQLFDESVTKTVNSNVICDTREELIQQMQDIYNTYGTKNIRLLSSLVDARQTTEVVHFEITYNDNSTECVIALLTCHEGTIHQINEVFGEKGAYQWNEEDRK